MTARTAACADVPERRAVALFGVARSGNLPLVLVAVAVLLAVLAGWLLLHNPTIDGTSRGDAYSCAAPYDTVLNDADNVPGGEPATDADDIAARCRSAGQDRFGLAVGVGVLGLLLGLTGAALA